MDKTVLFPGISAPQLTPFHDNGEVNYEEYTRLTRFLVEGGVKGIFVCGTTGEFANLTIEERKGLLTAAKKGAGPQCKLLYNITALNLKDIGTLCDWARQEGADGASVTAPYYHGYDKAALTEYFIRVSRMAAPLPVYLYNIPAMVRNVITPEILEAVCAACDNVWGIKDSSMDFMTFLKFQMAAPDQDFEILTGNDAQVLTALHAGGGGAVIALAGVFPSLCNTIYDSFQRGDLGAARQAQNTVLKLRDLVRGTIPVTAHKEMLKMQGFAMGKARFPFRELTKEEQQKVRDTVYELGVLR